MLSEDKKWYRVSLRFTGDHLPVSEIENWRLRSFGRLCQSVKNMSLHNSILTGCLVITLTSVLGRQDKTRSVILPEKAAQQISQLCSREGPPKFDSAWTPTDDDIRKMESQLSRISRLRSKGGIEGARIERPERYYRQYVGIVVAKRKLIYINAFCDEKPPSVWKESIVDVCDGGCSWGVVYDIEKGTFSDLEVNGIA